MKGQFLIAALVFLGLAVFSLGLGLHWWGPGSKMVEKDEMIHHPKYGTYPKVVPYEDGMTIYPGQSAELPFEIIIEKKKEDKGI